MKKVFLILLSTLFLISCQENENPANSGDPTLIELKVFDQYINENREVWAILQSKEGEILDIRKLENGKLEKFENLTDRNYHLTYILRESSPFMSQVNTTAFTYLSVSTGKTYTIGLPLGTFSGPDEPFNGFHRITLNFPNVPKGGFASSKNGRIPLSTNINGNQLDIAMLFRGENERIFVSGVGQEGQARYDFISNVSKDGQKQVDFSSMKNFDKTITVPKPSGFFSYTIIAMEENQNRYVNGYLIGTSSYGFNSNSSNLALGYLNEFKVYTTLFTANDNSKSISFFKVGSIPSKINLPFGKDISVSKNGVNDFRFTSPTGTDYSIITFRKSNDPNFPNEVLSWFVFGNQEEFTLRVPEELKTQYPVMSDLNLLKLESILSVESTYSYNDYVRNQLIEVPKLLQFETTQVLKFFN